MLLRKKVIIGVVSLFLLISLFVGYQNAHANGSNPLVETQWVEDNMAKVKLVHVGHYIEGDKKKYDSEHMPGSVYMEMNALMGAMRGSGTPDKAQFETLMGNLGISNDSHVVLFSTPAANPFVPSAYWLLKYFGHADVSILNGSLDKWKADGKKTIGNSADVSPVKYTASAGDASIFSDAANVLNNRKNPKVAIIDTRGGNEYNGTEKRDNIKAAGHIPGAINLNFFPSNRNDDGTYKSAADLKKAYEAAGVTKDKEIITYCEGGVRATDSYFALKDILGYPDVKVYIGSWMEWGNDAKYPVEK